MKNQNRGKLTDFETIFDNAKKVKNNKKLEENKIISLILEKICNGSLITNEFLDSISMEDINAAQQNIAYNSALILEMQKNTFLETVINKKVCVQTEDTEDFF